MQTKLLVRSQNFYQRYQQWLERELKNHLEMFRGSFANEVFGYGADDIRFERTGQYARITWQPTELSAEVLGFVMEKMKDVLTKDMYVLKLSDERTEILDSIGRVNIHRYYLKPENRNGQTGTGKRNTAFGNIFLEHRLTGSAGQFCITCNYFHNDGSGSIEKLMELLLGET